MRIVLILLIALVALLATGSVFAQATDQGVIEMHHTWSEILVRNAELVLRRPMLRNIVLNTFLVLATFVLLKSIYDINFNHVPLIDFFWALVKCHLVFAAIASYDTITQVIFGAAVELQAFYSTGLLGYSPRNGAWSELYMIMMHSTLEDLTVFDLTIMQVLTAINYFMLMIVLGLCAVIGGIYVHWGYLIAKLLGILFLPCILVRPLQQYFLNWLQMFLTVCFFAPLVGIIMPLILVAAKIAFDYDLTQPVGDQEVVLRLDGGLEHIALLAFLAMGCFYLFKAYSLAGALAGGSAQALSVSVIQPIKSVMGGIK